MNRTLALFLGVAASLLATNAVADDAPKSDCAPCADAAPAAALQPVVEHKRHDVGVGLVFGGAIGVTAGVVGNIAILAANSLDCEDGPCPRPVSGAAQAAAVAGTVAMGGLLVTGIYLLATDKPRPATTDARIRPSAGGVAFSF